jgi:hypothetical protein
MNNTQNLNATLDCIKETTTFAERIITNVCTGETTIIPIGFWEFGFGIFVGLLLLSILVMVMIMIYKVTTDY